MCGAVRSTNRKLPVLNVKKITFLQNVAPAWPDPRYVPAPFQSDGGFFELAADASWLA